MLGNRGAGKEGMGSNMDVEGSADGKAGRITKLEGKYPPIFSGISTDTNIGISGSEGISHFFQGERDQRERAIKQRERR